MLDHARCCFCQQETESVLHVLWSCGAAQDVWAGSLGRFQKLGTAQNDFFAAGLRSYGEAFLGRMESVLGYLLANMVSEEYDYSWRCFPTSFKFGQACC